jgi:DNA-binding beta-propeller fold protein YncE
VFPIKEGNTNYPNNPNVRVLGSALSPPLTPGTCTFNGGSEGPLTLTKDSSLGDLLARAPIFDSVGDMALGHALDNTFNNSALFGCQAGGGNICAITGLKFIQIQAGGANSLAPATSTALAVKQELGFANLVNFAPHPNPPPIVFPPLCLSPLINAQEPTAAGPTNLLVPGSNSRGNVAQNRPPTNIPAPVQNAFFTGPSVPQPVPSLCLNYFVRQQIGNFLYVIDRVGAEIVVLNSNRFTVIDRIHTPDPTSLAMSPNLDFLAVTNEGADQVSFIDTEPGSATFHQVVRTVPTGAGPTGIAWDSGNEDIFVCNQADGSVTIISAFTLRPRKTLRNQLTRPIDVALTPRQLGFGFRRGVYFGYILNQDGKVAVFESGPDGILGWGFDDTIGSLPFPFFRPKAIQPDLGRPNSAVWILHENRLDVSGNPTGDVGGAISNTGISSGIPTIVPFTSGAIVNPGFRDLGFGVFASLGEGPSGLSGIPVDIAFDNLFNVTAFTNYSSQFSAGQPRSLNGKSIIKFNGTSFQSASFPEFMFLAIPNPGVVDVLDLSTGTLKRVDANLFQPGLNSIPAPNVTVVADFFRQ